MGLKRSAVAIDLGTHTIRVVEVSFSDKGAVVQKGIVVERSELTDGGVDTKDPAALARAIRARMAMARLPARGVVLGIGGQDSMMRYTRIPPVPAWRLKVIMDYETGEVGEKVGEPLASDYRVLELPREPEEDQTILMGLAKEKPLQEILDAFEGAGITIEKAVPSAVAIATAHDAFGRKADPDSVDDDLLLIADLGAENLGIAIVLNGKLAFAKSVSFGGRIFTETVAAALGIPAGEAEKIKIARGGLDEREKGVLYDSVGPLRSAAGQLLGMLQSSLRFSSTQIGVSLPPLSRAVLMGGGMHLRGLPAFLAQGLGKPVELFQPAGLKAGPGMAEPASEALSESPSDFGVALGLGTSGLRDEKEGARASLSLLPSAYKKRREFKERTVYLYAAGILLVLLLVARSAQGFLRNSSARAVHSQLSQVQSRLAGQKKDLDETAKSADARRARLNRLLREAELTAFQAYVLDLLSRTLRPEMQLERVYLDAPPNDAGNDLDYNLRVVGRVNNEKRQGLDWILDLQSTLKADERIGSVDEESSKPQGAWYTFELSLRPSHVAY